MTNDLSRHVDPFGYRVISLLAALEHILGVLNACLPTLKPVFDKVLSSAMWSSASEITSQMMNHDGSKRIYMKKRPVKVVQRLPSKTGTAPREGCSDLELLTPIQQP